jgi:hypothetical protein
MESRKKSWSEMTDWEKQNQLSNEISAAQDNLIDSNASTELKNESAELIETLRWRKEQVQKGKL